MWFISITIIIFSCIIFQEMKWPNFILLCAKENAIVLPQHLLSVLSSADVSFSWKSLGKPHPNILLHIAQIVTYP